MNCPFLKEARVRDCTAAPVRKLIAEGHDGGALERCSTRAYKDCAVFQDRGGAAGDGARCPFLVEQLVQFCSVAPVTKFIPYSETANSRCGGDSFQYCSLYLGLSRPGLSSQTAGDHRDPVVEGLRVPKNLYYAPNHMWLDLSGNSACHVGIDAFLAQLLATVERISFVTLKGVRRPSVALTVEGVAWPLVFPNPILIGGANLYLRSNPARLPADPYGTGWLFEGWEAPSKNAREGLMDGPSAAAWMAQEMQRLNEFVHECAARRESPAGPIMNDGGVAAHGVLHQLTRDEQLRLFHEFFAPHAAWANQ